MARGKINAQWYGSYNEKLYLISQQAVMIYLMKILKNAAAKTTEYACTFI